MVSVASGGVWLSTAKAGRWTAALPTPKIPEIQTKVVIWQVHTPPDWIKFSFYLLFSDHKGRTWCWLAGPPERRKLKRNLPPNPCLSNSSPWMIIGSILTASPTLRILWRKTKEWAHSTYMEHHTEAQYKTNCVHQKSDNPVTINLFPFRHSSKPPKQSKANDSKPPLDMQGKEIVNKDT